MADGIQLNDDNNHHQDLDLEEVEVVIADHNICYCYSESPPNFHFRFASGFLQKPFVLYTMTKLNFRETGFLYFVRHTTFLIPVFRFGHRTWKPHGHNASERTDAYEPLEGMLEMVRVQSYLW